ncbi:MAG: SPASM domain-containing protein [Nitrospirae bacterium]|nr:SPASM domain-containing protein [Nitrospirota bacterium]MBF0536073.1 SPASM domain-containing protein [Nitrospirota bacterium]MBF0617966.1 SPASM domain-containing protein [Nitrospirota bacterium]
MKKLKTIDEIPKDHRVSIYGSGQSGIMLKNLLEELRPDIRIVCFLDSFNSGEKEGLKVVNIRDAFQIKSLYDLILIASDFWKDIVSTLIQHKITENYKVVNCHKLKYYKEHFLSDKPLVPCHYYELFVKHDGYVYPCCITRDNSDMAIGHVTDDNLAQMIANFDGCCVCERSRFRKAVQGDIQKYVMLNFELDLACHSKCAMCCVSAPSWNGHYGQYESLTKLVDITMPKVIKVQGGEVLIQKKSLHWIDSIKQKYPNILFSLITNGNYRLSIINAVEKRFNKVAVSTIVGFQSETYKTITGLDLKRTIRFAEELVSRKRLVVTLAYLITPINVHEVTLFMKWAINTAPDIIHIYDSEIHQYINSDTFDSFWEKIFNRTAETFKTGLLALKSEILAKGTVIWISRRSMELLKIDRLFLKNNHLDKNVFLSNEAFSTIFDNALSGKENWGTGKSFL